MPHAALIPPPHPHTHAHTHTSPSWYYDAGRIKSDFGRGGITKYEAAVEHFPGSIMALSNTGGAGRGSNDGDIIGTVINHGKKKYWARGGNFHYHHGLRPGENTLEAQLFRLVARELTASGGAVDVDALRGAYVEFMTTPGSHNDTYASTCHRMFFKNRADGKPLDQCPDNDNHNVDTMDGLVMAIPAILAHAAAAAAAGGAAGGGAESCAADTASAVRSTIAVTRDSKQVGDYAQVLTRVLHEVLAARDGGDAGATLRAALEGAALEHLNLDLRRAVTLSRGDPMTS